ncbi:MAG: CPBP family intramembrane metalloprotease [Planctomycetota bacterium]|nr:MAG: CPBP family intramembrane metalloprotease [Planctomycetota bacterium]
MSGGNSSRRDMLGAAFAVEGGLVGLALVLGWLVGEPPLAQIRLTAAGCLWGLAAVVPLLVMLVLVDRYPLGPLKSFGEMVHRYLVPLFRGCTLRDLLAISGLAGLGEEMLFRGVVQGGLTTWWHHPWPAIVAAGVLFGLAHMITPTYAVLAGAIGIYLGWLYVATGNLLAPIVAHAAYDFAALVYLVRLTPVDSDAPAGEWSI